jgi:hypothetical protein
VRVTVRRVDRIVRRALVRRFVGLRRRRRGFANRSMRLRRCEARVGNYPGRRAMKKLRGDSSALSAGNRREHVEA